MDGVDHINIYSKGKTSLGRWLSNFTNAPIVLKDGKFNSIEGYWYWLYSKDDRLRNLYGYEAKALGKSLEGSRMDETVFRNKIKQAILTKLLTYPEMLNELRSTIAPFRHYYNYGGKIVELPQYGWIVDFFEYLKDITVVGVIGSRTYTDAKKVFDTLDDLGYDKICVVSGGAAGADTLAKEWATHRNHLFHEFIPDWDDISQKDALIRINKYGKKYDAKAGFRRNQQIIDASNVLYAFHYGTNGTKDSISRAKKKGIEIYEF